MFIDSFCGVSSGGNNTALDDISLGSFSPCFTDVVLIGIVHIVMVILMILRCIQIRRFKPLKMKRGSVHITLSKVKLAIAFILAIIPLLQLQSILTQTIGKKNDPYSPNPGKALPYQVFSSALSAAACSFLAAVLAYEVIGRTARNGLWIYRFLWLFELASQTIKLYFVVSLSQESGADSTYFFYLYLAQYALTAVLATLGMSDWPSRASYSEIQPHSAALPSSEELQSPLLDSLDIADDDKEKSGSNTYPEYTSNVLSRLLFSWVTSLVRLGYKRPLEASDIWDLDDRDSASNLHERFSVEWRKEISKEGKPPSLFKALFRVFGAKFILGGFWKLFNDASQFVGPIILGKMIGYVKAPNSSIAIGFAYACAMFMGQIVGALGEGQYYQNVMKVGLKVRSSLTAAIFKKSLKLHFGKAKSGNAKMSRGKLVNMISSDTEALQSVCQNAHTLWSSPLRIIISLCLLYAKLGVASLAGLGIMVLMFPLQRFVVKKSGAYLRKSLAQTDERLKLESETIASISVVKMYAWEASMRAKIEKVRNEELMWLKKSAILRALNSFFISAVPIFVSVGTFAVFTLIPGNVFTAEVAFTSLSLFSVLRMPLFLLPNTITQLIAARVSLRRLQDYMVMTDAESHRGGNGPKHDKPAVAVGGKFTWTEMSGSAL